MASYNVRIHRKFGKQTKAFTEQRKYVCECAQKLFETKGVQKTTLADIAREASMTRELIYYYFSSKNEIIEEVIGSYVQDALDATLLWCETWDPVVETYNRASAWEGMQNSGQLDRIVMDIVASIRRFIFTNDGDCRPMYNVINELGMRTTFLSQVCKGMANQYMDRPSFQLFVNNYVRLNTEQVGDLLKFLISGTITLMEAGRGRDDLSIARLLLYGIAPSNTGAFAGSNERNYAV